MSSPDSGSGKGFSLTEWLVLLVAVIGFACDIYELLMLPVIQQAALAELLQLPPGHPQIREWFVTINSSAAVCGGIFGLLGGWLIDRFGRKRILVLSILIYGVSPVFAAFSTSPTELLIFRCTTFIGVCVEFVAAVAWLAELFPEPKKRESVLSITQAFSSFGGLMVTGMNRLMIEYKERLPSLGLEQPFNAHADWRYTLISGLIPAIPILLLLPFLPESPAWKKRKAEGTLKRPSFGELFGPTLRRTTIVCTILFACAYGAAFGAIQLTPGLIAPGVPELAEHQKELAPLRKQAAEQFKKFDQSQPGTDERKAIGKSLKELGAKQKEHQDVISKFTNQAQLYQEMGGLTGRVLFAVVVMMVVSRRKQLLIFLLPGLILVPTFFAIYALQGQEALLWGVALVALFTLAQPSFLGNYLPAAYPVHLRGTAGGFAANVGGRMIGGSMGLVTSLVVVNMILKPAYPGLKDPQITAYAAAIVGGTMFLIALVTSFFLPEPKPTEAESISPS
jgi:MFS family permease